MKYMLDTNICIYALKKQPAVLNRLTSLGDEEIAISSVTQAELEFGVQNSERKERNAVALALFLSALTILPFDSSAAAVYGCIRADLKRKGTPIGPMDMMIAAHALSEDLVLVTNNTKEFERVPDLRLENWT